MPRKYQTAKNKSTGATQETMVETSPPEGTPLTVIPFPSSFSASAGSTRAVTKADFPLGNLSLSLPSMMSWPIETSLTWLFATSCSNWL